MFEFMHYDYLYDWISCLVPNSIYFGPYPSQCMINELEKNKFDIIVNLTEHSIMYQVSTSTLIHYPVCDNSFPNNISSYINLIISLKNLFNKGNKIYIHCRGGHGRSSMVCVSLMYILVPSYQLYETISYVNRCHLSRVNLRERWKKRKSPFNIEQYRFLSKIHKNIYINTNKNNYYRWLLTYDKKDKNNENIKDEKIFNEGMSVYEVYKNLYIYLRNYVEQMRYTYLKKFILTDYSNQFSLMFNEAVIFTRELLCYCS